MQKLGQLAARQALAPLSSFMNVCTHVAMNACMHACMFSRISKPSACGAELGTSFAVFLSPQSIQRLKVFGSMAQGVWLKGSKNYSCLNYAIER
jgi:hypothetical protein